MAYNEGRLPDLAPILAHWSHNFDFMGRCKRCRAVEGTALASGLCAGWIHEGDSSFPSWPSVQIAEKLACSQADAAWDRWKAEFPNKANRPSLGMRWARGLLIVASCAINVWTFLFLVRWILP